MLSPESNKWIPNSLRFLGSVSFIICLVLAAILWFMAKLSKEASKDVNYHLSYELPTGKAFSKAPRKLIRAKMKGQGFTLFFSPNEETLRVPLTNNRVQHLSQVILSELIRNKHKSGLYSLEALESGGFEITLDEEMLKKVPVVLQNKIISASGYKIKEGIQIIPDSILIKGPKTITKHIDFVEVDNISHINRKENIQEIAKILTDSTGLLDYSASEVKIEVNIDAITEKSLILPIVTTNDTLKCIPSRAELVFEIGLSEFESYGPENFKIGFNVRGNTAADKAELILIQKPKNINKFKIRPDSVRLIYEMRKGQ